MNLTKHSDQLHELTLCSSLLQFLAVREDLSTFVVHDWLITLGDRDLHRVEQDAYDIVQATHPGPISAQGKDIAALVTIAVGAEAGHRISREVVLKNLDLFIARLMLTACAERLRRAGWVYITEKTSLSSSNPPAVTFSATGLLEAAQSEDKIVSSLLKMSSALQ